MTTTTGRPTAMTHLGLFYDDPDDLVASVVPHLDRALERGDTVSTLVDRRTARGLRDALGERAARLTFASPHAGPRGVEDTLRRFREAATPPPGDPGRRTLVLAQYSAFAALAPDIALNEDGINLVLGDLPCTLVCACGRDADPVLLDTARHSHPSWVDGPGAADNPAFRAPADRTPTASTVWGGVHVLRLHFGATADLHRVRTHVAALAAEVGLRGEPAQAAVFAVHEAAVVACDEVEDARASAGRAPAPVAPALPAPPAATRGRPGPDDPCVLDVWTAGSRLVAEVRGPRATGGLRAPRPDLDEIDGRVPRNRLRMAGPLRVVRTFCRDVGTHETPGARTIRLVVGG